MFWIPVKIGVHAGDISQKECDGRYILISLLYLFNYYLRIVRLNLEFAIFISEITL